ncbi:MAG: carbohydrate ABC transporter permease [Eubacteriales bacterium]|nr:carbohydrate ABC transporter permease [Eubacteriales bacterium]
MNKGIHKKLCTADKITYLVFDLILTILFVIVAYPLILIISSSVSSSSAVVTGRVKLLPVEPTLLGYQTVFRTKSVWTGYLNSFYYAVLGTSINLVMTCLAAYPLSRKDLRGRNLIMGLFTFTMFFSGGLIPGFLLVSDLGMMNTVWAMVLPGAISVYNMILARTYFQSSIPVELLEASQIDGCNNTRFILKVVIPLSKPILAVLCLYYAVGHWNSYLNALLYLNDARRYPLQIVLRDILMLTQVDFSESLDTEFLLKQQEIATLMKYSLIIVASLPVLIAYPFVQKYFVKGVMIGSLKG